MSLITFPDNLCISSFSWTPLRNEVVNRSPFGSQALEIATPLWMVSAVGVPEYRAEAVILEQLFESLAGFRNQLAMHNYAHPIPSGTLRGTLALVDPVLEGDTVIYVDGGPTQAGRTLIRGDLLGMGTGLTQQVLRVAADTTADVDGVIEVTLNSSSRVAYAAAVEVRWDKPKALFRQRQNAAGITYIPGLIGQAWSLDLLEDVRP